MIRKPSVSLIVPSLTGSVEGLDRQLARQSLQPGERIVVRGITPPARARNRGAAQATGELLVFLDDDVTLAQPALLERLVSMAQQLGPQAVVGVEWRLPPHVTPFQRRQIQESFTRRPIAAREGLQEIRWDSLGASCVAVHRATFHDAGGFDEHVRAGEDHELWYRLTQRGARVYLLAEHWIYHEPPRTFLEAVRKTIWYEWGNAQVARKHPTAGYRLVLRGWWHVLGYLALRTAALPLLVWLKVSYRHRRPTWEFRPMSALLSYVGAWAYCVSWLASAPQRPVRMAQEPLRRLRLFCVDRPRLKTPIKRARYLALRAASLASGAGLESGTRMIGYHAVGEGCSDLSVSVEQFRQQLEWLLRHGYQVLTLRRWWELVRAGAAPPERSVILSFDDGFQSVARHAAPLLAERGLEATLFVVADYVGRTNAFDRPFLHGPESALLTWREIETLQRLGWDIQSHGRRHRPVARLSPAALDEELGGSKRLLEARLGTAVDFFCYPYGAFDRAAAEAMARAGYAGGVTCRSGRLPERLEGDWHRLPRTLIDGLMSPGDFAAVFRRGYLRLARCDRWLLRRFGTDEECLLDELDRLATGTVP